VIDWHIIIKLVVFAFVVLVPVITLVKMNQVLRRVNRIEGVAKSLDIRTKRLARMEDLCEAHTKD